MSRQLLIKCDGPGCEQTVTTGTSDIAPAQINAPDFWYTLHHSGNPDQHFCSIVCVGHWADPPKISPLVLIPPNVAASVPAIPETTVIVDGSSKVPAKGKKS